MTDTSASSTSITSPRRARLPPPPTLTCTHTSAHAYTRPHTPLLCERYIAPYYALVVPCRSLLHGVVFRRSSLRESGGSYLSSSPARAHTHTLTLSLSPSRARSHAFSLRRCVTEAAVRACWSLYSASTSTQTSPGKGRGGGGEVGLPPFASTLVSLLSQMDTLTQQIGLVPLLVRPRVLPLSLSHTRTLCLHVYIFIWCN